MQRSSKDYKEYRRMISILKTAKLSVPYCDENQENNELILFLRYIGKGTSIDKSKGYSVVHEWDDALLIKLVI